MKMSIVAAAAAMLIAGTVQAQGVNDRQYNQARRIDHGVATGRLTPGEAARLDRQQGSIARQEDRMRYRNGGHLSGRDRAILRQRQARANRHIYRAKHNYRHY